MDSASSGSSRSNGRGANGNTAGTNVGGGGYMSGEEQDERRKAIKEIMKDPALSQQEKSKSIQQLMDGRRGSMCSTAGSVGTDVSRNSAGGNGGAGGACAPVSGGPPATASTYVSTMAPFAAAAAEYYSSDEEGDAMMSDCPDDISLGYGPYGYGDDRSINSSVTHTSHEVASYAAAIGASAVVPAPGKYRQIHGRASSLQYWTDSDRAVAAASAANTSTFMENPEQINKLMEQSRPECEHYDRRCTLISPCCGLAFGCRLCHDECPVLPTPLDLSGGNSYRGRNPPRAAAAAASASGGGGAAAIDATDGGSMIDAIRYKTPDGMFVDSNNNNEMDTSMQKAGGGSMLAHWRQAKAGRRHSMPLDLEEEEEEHHHIIDRFAVREILCRKCYTRQSSKTNNCVNCGITFAEYHCNICNLWMSNKEEPYHCIDCGFCRVGGRENFRHCDDCGMCIDTMLFDDHNCKAGKYMNNCPICQEDLFSSRYASHEMPCGHAIHWHCFRELTSYDTRCPVCKKTAETPEQMAATWSALAMGIALQPVPPELARVVDIVCNDCEANDERRRWHFLGVRCMNCLSFNTNVERILMQGQDAADYLDQMEAMALNNSRSNMTGVAAAAAAGAASASGSPSMAQINGVGGVPSSVVSMNAPASPAAGAAAASPTSAANAAPTDGGMDTTGNVAQNDRTS